MSKNGTATKKKKATPPPKLENEISSTRTVELSSLLEKIEHFQDELAFAEGEFEAKRLELCREMNLSPRLYYPMRKPDGPWIMGIPRREG